MVPEPSLEARMKSYENDPVIPNDQFMIIRIDGNRFSRFTELFGARKPYDHRIHQAMVEASIAVRNYFNGILFYTQSDESTIVVPPASFVRAFGSRTQKTASIAASLFTNHFMAYIERNGWNEDALIATFDARVFGIASKNEVANNLLWRMKDAERNWTQACANKAYGPGQISGVPNSQLVTMMAQDDNPEWKGFEGLGSMQFSKFKRGDLIKFKPESLTFATVSARVENALILANTPRASLDLNQDELKTEAPEEPKSLKRDFYRQEILDHMAEMQKKTSGMQDIEFDLDDDLFESLQREALHSRVPVSALIGYLIIKRIRQHVKEEAPENATEEILGSTTP